MEGKYTAEDLSKLGQAIENAAHSMRRGGKREGAGRKATGRKTVSKNMIARIGIGEHREFDEEVVPVVRKRHGIRVIDIPERDARSFPCGNGP